MAWFSLSVLAFCVGFSGCKTEPSASTSQHDNISALEARRGVIAQRLAALESNKPEECPPTWIFFPLWHMIDTSSSTSVSTCSR